MPRIVFIGAGSLFGARSFVDLMTFPELHDCDLVLVDINPSHLEPVAAYCRKVAAHYKAPVRISTAAGWRDGVLDGADFVIASFAQGGPAYAGVPYHHEICVPQEYGIYQNIGDTAGIGGVLRGLRTAPELLAIAHDMENRCPGAVLLNYVNPMAILTRTIRRACPKVKAYGLCHNIQNAVYSIAKWVGVEYKALRYEAAGVNHMDWFLRLEYLDGRDAYPDLHKAAARPEVRKERSTQFELLKQFGYFTTESSGHCAEYLPYFMMRPDDRAALGIEVARPAAEVPAVSSRWGADSKLRQQIDGRLPLQLWRSPEYGIRIIHASVTDTVHRMHLNVMNDGLLDQFSLEACVEVPCVADRCGIHPMRVGRLPVQLAALSRGLADMQTLASDAILEKNLDKARMACLIDPMTAASATPARISACFHRLVELERPFLQFESDHKKQ